MSVALVCDFCGELVDDELYMSFTLVGCTPTKRAHLPGYPDLNVDRHYEQRWGLYHSSDERPCWWQFRGALLAVENASKAATLDTIPVATPQKIAALRRKHTHPAGGAR